MSARVDLHLHTTASDGRWTPEELMLRVQEAGIDLFAVTDHDSLGSLARTSEQARGNGHRFLPGVELSARLNGQAYHLLAYGFDPLDTGLTELAEATSARLSGASDQAVERLIEAGYPISLDEYAAYTWDRQRGGWKALNFLIDRGFCHGVDDYFGKLFVGELEHPQARFPSPEQVIAIAQQAGAVVILAHPGAPFYNGLDAKRIDELVDMGLEGLECYSFHHDQATTQGFLDYCHSRNLLITGGSDCHGGFAGRSLGVPPVYLDDLRLGRLEDLING